MEIKNMNLEELYDYSCDLKNEIQDTERELDIKKEYKCSEIQHPNNATLFSKMILLQSNIFVKLMKSQIPPLEYKLKQLKEKFEELEVYVNGL